MTRMGLMVAIVLVAISAASLRAQETSAAAAADTVTDTVTIDYPDELPLIGLVDYASRTLGLRILYGDELDGKSVVLRPSPITLPRERLLDLLRSVLRMEGLALVADELKGFYRVVRSADLPRVAGEVRVGGADGEIVAGRVVTQAIRIPSGQTKRVAAQLKAFLSSPQSSLIEVAEAGIVLVTDYEPVVARLTRLVDLIDVAPPEVVTRIVTIEHADVARVADQVRRVTGAQSKQLPGGTVELDILDDVVPAALVLVGTAERIDTAQKLIADLDVVSDAAVPTQSYSPEHISATRLRTLVQQLVLTDAGALASARAFVDEATNRLYLTCAPAVHRRVRLLVNDVDVPLPRSARAMRTYRPKHRAADEILDTLTQLLEEATVTTFASRASTTGEFASVRPPGRNRPPAQPARVQIPPMPPAQEPMEDESRTKTGATRVEGPGYVLTVDQHTNTIIAIGSPEFHGQLSDLLDELDKRRPQVLIEMTLVAVSLSDSLDLGVELQIQDLLGEGFDYLLFSSFGLSSIDIGSGRRVFEPGVGANGILIGPETIPILFKALATNGMSRVISTPRILVSDNATGVIRSVDEAPFTSVNASNTVATTSFAGFASAGTTLTVTPHIAEGDHLALDYSLGFSNFSGAASSATAPPPRTTNSFSSTIEVPDGYTVVVGGLIVEDQSDIVSEVPLLGRIPILGALFQNSAASRKRSRIFAFIRPVILRDDRFADIKYITEGQLKQAELENRDYPPDNPMWMR